MTRDREKAQCSEVQTVASTPLRPPPTASQYSRSRTCFRLREDDLRPPEDVLRPAAEVRAAQRCFLCGEPRPGPTPARPFLRMTPQEDGARACQSAGPHASGRSWTGMPSKRGHVRGGTSHRSRRRPPWKRGSPPDADAFSAPPIPSAIVPPTCPSWFLTLTVTWGVSASQIRQAQSLLSGPGSVLR